MSYAAASARYQEMEVLSATPGQLVVMVYDHLIVSLKRARLAVERGDIEQRVVNAARARDAVAELLATLDHVRGGDVAGGLASLYTFFLTELTDIGARPSIDRLDRITAMVQDLRDAFAEIAAPGAQVAQVA